MVMASEAHAIPPRRTGCLSVGGHHEGKQSPVLSKHLLVFPNRRQKSGIVHEISKFLHNKKIEL